MVAKTRRVRRTNKTTKVKKELMTTLPGPEDLTQPSDNLFDYCTLVYGQSAIGKTSMAACIPNSLVVQLDPMREDLRIRQVAIEQPSLEELNKTKPTHSPWDEFVNILTLADKDDTINTVIVDNFQRLYDMALQDVCYKNGYDNPADANDYGVTWNIIDKTLEVTLNLFRQSGNGLWLLSHGNHREVVPPVGDAYQQWEPDLTKRVMNYVKSNCTFVFNYVMYKGKRVIMVRSPDESAWTKCCEDQQVPRFTDPDGKRINFINAGSSPQEAHDNVVASFNNELRDAFYKPPKTEKPRRRRRS